MQNASKYSKKFSGQASTSKKTEKGHQAEAQLEVLNYPVMGVEVRKHGFKDTAPASYHIEKLVGRYLTKQTWNLLFPSSHAIKKSY